MDHPEGRIDKARTVDQDAGAGRHELDETGAQIMAVAETLRCSHRNTFCAHFAERIAGRIPLLGSPLEKAFEALTVDCAFAGDRNVGDAALHRSAASSSSTSVPSHRVSTSGR